MKRWLPIFLLMAACTAPATITSTPRPSATTGSTSTPVVITIVVTATPSDTLEPSPTNTSTETATNTPIASPTRTLTPTNSPTQTPVVVTKIVTVTPTLTPTLGTTRFPVQLTMPPPMAVQTINLINAICKNRNTQVWLWPWELKRILDEIAYGNCVTTLRLGSATRSIRTAWANRPVDE